VKPPQDPEVHSEVPGRVLGLDLGDARIGVAVSDERRRVAVPVGTIRTGAPQDLRAVAALVDEHHASVVVVGLPLSMSGRTGERAAAAGQFASALRSFLSVPVVLHDERLSTAEADRALRRSGMGGKERRSVVDQAAATVILQSWLDANR
jgi:putative Holliday junction resolvase